MKRFALLALVLVCSFMLCMCAQDPTPTTTPEPETTAPIITEPPFVENVKLYWRIGAVSKVNNKLVARFAVDGKQVELTVPDEALVAQIDFQPVMGLEINDKNEITAVIPYGAGTGGVAVNAAYVKSVSGTTATLNTNSSGNGVDFKLDVKNAKVYDVSTTGAECGKKTELKKGDKVFGIQDRKGNLTELYVVERIQVVVDISHTDHCVCGGVGANSHTCEVAGEWIPWGDDHNEQNKMPTKSGKYYLVADMKITSRHTFPEGSDITICLNGKHVTSADRVFGVYGKLTMCDCKFTKEGETVKYTGTVEMSYNGPSASGGIFYVYDGCLINVFSGNYVATASISNGGLFQTRAGGTFNLYGGYFADGNVANKGGNINMMDGGTLNIYGGEITGGSADQGGGLCLTKGTLNISGNPKIHGNAVSNLYICDGMTVNFGKLTDGVNIGITLESGVGVVGTAESEEDAMKLKADSEDKKIVWDSATKQVSIVAK